MLGYDSNWSENWNEPIHKGAAAVIHVEISGISISESQTSTSMYSTKFTRFREEDHWDREFVKASILFSIEKWIFWYEECTELSSPTVIYRVFQNNADNEMECF